MYNELIRDRSSASRFFPLLSPRSSFSSATWHTDDEDGIEFLMLSASLTSETDFNLPLLSACESVVCVCERLSEMPMLL